MTDIIAMNKHLHCRGRRASDAHLIIKWWSFYAMMIWAVGATSAALFLGGLLYLHVQENAEMSVELAKTRKPDLVPVYKKKCAPPAPQDAKSS